VKISPRASTSTRLPEGEREMFVMRAVTSSQRGIIQGKSPTTRMFTVVAARLRVEFMDVARLLEHHGLGAAVHGLDVVVGELRDLRELLRRGVVRPHVRHTIAI
jgi:hypothetical protein